MTLNTKIISEFEKLIEQIKYNIDQAPSRAEATPHLFRLKQVKAALNIIKNSPSEIKKGEDLQGTKGIGKGTISRINEILETGKLSELKIKKKDMKVMDQIEELEDIIGIGRKTAHELVTKHKIKNIDDLKKAHKAGKIELTHSVVMGLKYHNVYQENIPRAEIDKVNKYLQQVAQRMDKNLKLVICGSYRRLKSTSGDIDIMVTHTKVKTKAQLRDEDSTNYLIKLVDKLKKDGFIVDDLTDKDYREKYMGFCQLKGHLIRRIDIRYLPHNSYYTGLLYFTGSGSFNEKMRRTAIDLGFMLNEYGLYKVKDDGTKMKISVSSEKDIFTALGLEYLSPEKR